MLAIGGWGDLFLPKNVYPFRQIEGADHFNIIRAKLSKCCGAMLAMFHPPASGLPLLLGQSLPGTLSENLGRLPALPMADPELKFTPHCTELGKYNLHF